MEIKGFTYGWDSHKGMLGTEKANESVKALAAMGGNWVASGICGNSGEVFFLTLRHGLPLC